MHGWFRSRALRWSAIFWILSVLAAHQGRHLWQQYQQAGLALQAAREHSLSLETELNKFRRLIATVPKMDSTTAPIEERLAVLLQRLRKAEPETRVVIQSVGAQGAGAEKHEAMALVQPIASFPGAGSIGLAVEGSYLTLSGLEEFLAAGRRSGASLSALTVQDRHFQAAFRLYGRL